MNNKDLRESIKLMQDIRGKQIKRSPMWNFCDEHLRTLIKIQTKRARNVEISLDKEKYRTKVVT